MANRVIRLAVLIGMLPTVGYEAASEESPAPVISKTVGASIQAKPLFGGELVDGIPTRLSAVAVDRGGIVWVGSEAAGVFALKDGRFTLLDQYNTAMPACWIKAIYVDRQNKKWFLSRRGYIFTFDNSKWEVIAQPDPILGSFDLLCGDPRGRIWLGQQRGIVRCLNNGLVVDPDLNFGGPGKFAEGHLAGIAVDGRGQVWFGYDRALAVLDGEQWTVYRPSQIPRGGITTIACAPDGKSAYLGTNDGLYCFEDGKFEQLTDAGDGRFEFLRAFPNGRFVADVATPWSFPPKRQKRIGVVVRDRKEISRYSEGSQIHGLSLNDAAFSDASGAWLATYDGLFNLKGTEWSAFHPEKDQSGVRRWRRPLLAWQRLSQLEQANAEVTDVDIHNVIANPLPFLNKKLRIEGHIESGFEYAELVGIHGEHLHIWPNCNAALSRFQQTPTWKELVEPINTREFLGFLEWGGGFGHMNGSPMQFTSVEEYPLGIAPERKAEIRKEYLKSLGAPPGE
jgi:hypothetical protein